MKLKQIIAALAVLVCATAAHAQSAGSFILNAGWTYVAKKESAANFSGTAFKSISGESTNSFGLSGTYFITDNLAGELALSTPARINLKGAYRADYKLASVEQFSPALLLKYYFLNAEDKLRPYIGVGASRVSFRKTESYAKYINFDFKNKWAPVFNAGFTYQFTDQLFGGVSVTAMPLDAGTVTAVYTERGTGRVASSTSKLKLDPITTFVSIGYKF